MRTEFIVVYIILQCTSCDVFLSVFVMFSLAGRFRSNFIDHFLLCYFLSYNNNIIPNNIYCYTNYLLTLTTGYGKGRLLLPGGCGFP